MLSRQEIREALTGPFASICTPFCRDGSIDFASLRNLIDFLVDAGSKTMLLTPGDSLYTILTDEEIAEVTRVVVEHTAGRAMVVAAGNEWATPKAVEFAQYACTAGADVLMVAPPDWGASCTPETLVEYYAAAAEHMPVMVVTASLSRRPTDFALEVLRMLMEGVDGVVALKDDICGEFARRAGLLLHEHWATFSGGTKQNHMNMLPYGCDGYMSVFVSFKPEIAHNYWNAIQSMDLSTARDIIRDYDMPYFDCIGLCQGGCDAGMHATLELFGITQRWRRKPYASATDEDMEMLADFCKGKSLL